MNYKIREIGGIGESNADLLVMASIATTGDLLETCATPSSREKTSQATGISSLRLLEWAHLAELMRINGVGRQYAELLWATGVQNVSQLRQWQAADLIEALEQTNQGNRFSKIIPLERQVAAWISQSRAMSPLIEL